MALAKNEPKNYESEEYAFDPDEQGETWEGMYHLMRCPVPRC